MLHGRVSSGIAYLANFGLFWGDFFKFLYTLGLFFFLNPQIQNVNNMLNETRLSEESSFLRVSMPAHVLYSFTISYILPIYLILTSSTHFK